MQRRPPEWRRAFGPTGLVPLLLLLASCATNPVTGDPDFVLVDEQQEVELGRKSHAQVLRAYPAYRDARLQDYVSAIGQKLARQSHRAELAWTFTVVDSAELNAFALPGGYVYVTRGLMACLADEAELAGVLGHEIGHVSARHGVRRQSASKAATVVGTLFGSAIDSYLGTSNTFSRVGSGAAGVFAISYGREQELEADQLGAQYLARTGYDAQAMARAIEVLQLQDAFARDTGRSEGEAASAMPAWLSSHPSNDQRLARIQRGAAAYAPAGDAGQARYLAAIDGMTFGDDPGQGVIRGRDFFHKGLGLALRLPRDWRAKNNGAQVTAASQDRTATFLMRPVPKGYVTQDDFLLRGLKIQTFPTKFTINGLAATRVAGQSQGKPYTLTLVRLDNTDYMLLASAKDAAAATAHAEEFDSIARSFRAMDEADRSAARPWVIRTRPAAPGQTIAPMALASPMANDAEAQLRLLNRLYPSGEPREGTTVKVIE